MRPLNMISTAILEVPKLAPRVTIHCNQIVGFLEAGVLTCFVH